MAAQDTGTMKILDRTPGERAAGEAAFRAINGRDPMATDYHQWTDPFPDLPENTGPKGNITAALGGGGQAPAGGGGGYRLEGFDSGKLGNAEHNTPKYQIARALQNFDPKAGVTPEVLAALNALGIGTFEGQGDKVRVSGNMDPRFEGYTTIDLVRGFKGPGGGQAWQYGAENPNAPAAGASPSLNARALQALMGGGGQATNPGQRLPDVQPVNEVGAPTTFAPVQTDVDRAALDQLMGGAARRRG